MNAELDAQVAREIMGWTVLTPAEAMRVKLSDLDEVIPTLFVGEQQILFAYYRKPPYERPWRPSIDIIAAFEVIAEMQRKGWQYEVGSHHAFHSASFHFGDWNELLARYDGDQHCAVCNTPAEAICRAALDAVRYPVQPVKTPDA